MLDEITKRELGLRMAADEPLVRARLPRGTDSNLCSQRTDTPPALLGIHCGWSGRRGTGELSGLSVWPEASSRRRP